jgi:hypothetical protein
MVVKNKQDLIYVKSILSRLYGHITAMERGLFNGYRYFDSVYMRQVIQNVDLKKSQTFVTRQLSRCLKTFSDYSVDFIISYDTDGLGCHLISTEKHFEIYIKDEDHKLRILAMVQRILENVTIEKKYKKVEQIKPEIIPSKFNSVISFAYKNYAIIKNENLNKFGILYVNNLQTRFVVEPSMSMIELMGDLDKILKLFNLTLVSEKYKKTEV